MTSFRWDAATWGPGWGQQVILSPQPQRGCKVCFDTDPTLNCSLISYSVQDVATSFWSVGIWSDVWYFFGERCFTSTYLGKMKPFGRVRLFSRMKLSVWYKGVFRMSGCHHPQQWCLISPQQQREPRRYQERHRKEQLQTGAFSYECPEFVRTVAECLVWARLPLLMEIALWRPWGRAAAVGKVTVTCSGPGKTILAANGPAFPSNRH